MTDKDLAALIRSFCLQRVIAYEYDLKFKNINNQQKLAKSKMLMIEVISEKDRLQRPFPP